ncbi:hypothetical protein E2562_035655 [Oryza meyeriana var. granulata]|uniref:Pentacotripeptide-repeat region of PRORP domain-containing protein n=1 Tax=Oryza meyeriana var. granulata TaxID=110450 RepID=A0A6G1FFM9_9ORYZ|nr:hypothetical protein E2562_035655 [Oryza meyeriana var. granulata]
MRSAGPAPNALTFNTAFNGLLRLGHLDAAHAVLEETWLGCRFVPSFTTVDRLIKKAVSGSNFDLALKVFDLMLRLCYLPTLPIANYIVSILLKSGGAETAYEVFMVLALALFCNLKKRGLSLNVYSYTALVFGFCKEKLWAEAYRVLEMMCNEGCKPSVGTYTVVVNFFCKDGNTDDAMHVLRMACKKAVVLIAPYAMCYSMHSAVKIDSRKLV